KSTRERRFVDRAFPWNEDGNQVRRHSAPDALLSFRPPRRHIYDAAHVYGTDIRLDFGTLRANQPYYRPRAIHSSAHGRNRQRGRTDRHRAKMVLAENRPREAGGMTCSNTSSSPMMARRVVCALSRWLVTSPRRTIPHCT